MNKVKQLVNFSTTVINCPDKINFMEKGFIMAHSWRVSLSCWESPESRILRVMVLVFPESGSWKCWILNHTSFLSFHSTHNTSSWKRACQTQDGYGEMLSKFRHSLKPVFWSLAPSNVEILPSIESVLPTAVHVNTP